MIETVTEATPVEVDNPESGDDSDLRPVSGIPLWVRWTRVHRQNPRSPQLARWLAEARRGAGKEPGSVPALWPLYQEHRFYGDDFDGDLELQADHVCMVLFAMHQQSENQAMHRSGVQFGEALRALRNSERFRERAEALDARVYAAATATGIGELESHLRSVTALLKAEGIGLDYGLLYCDVLQWLRPGGATGVRQRWGRDYYWQPSKKSRPEATASLSTSPKGN